MVRQVECSEPGCPPVETVIALLAEAAAPRQWKLPVPLEEVTHESLLKVLASDGYWQPAQWSCPD